MSFILHAASWNFWFALCTMLNCEHVTCATLMVSWFDEHGHVIYYLLICDGHDLKIVICSLLWYGMCGHWTRWSMWLSTRVHRPQSTLLSGKVVSTLCSTVLRSTHILHEWCVHSCSLLLSTLDCYCLCGVALCLVNWFVCSVQLVVFLFMAVGSRVSRSGWIFIRRGVRVGT